MEDTAKSKITYHVTIDDMIAYNLHYFRNSSAIQKALRRQLLTTMAITFLSVLIIADKTNAMSPLHPIFAASLAAALIAGYLRFYAKRGYIPRVTKLVKKMFAEHNNPGVLGEHTLEADADGFTDITEYNHSRYAWAKMVRIESEPGYTYLFTGAATAIIVPHDQIVSGSLKGIMSQIEQHYHPEKLLAQ